MATANPFSLPSIGADNPLAPEYLALERQKKIADLLMQKGQEIPQGQMVSGHYVAPSWTQQLGTLANAYMGGNMAEQTEQKTAKLAQLLRGQNESEVKNILEKTFGSPDYKPESMPEIQRDDQGNLMPAIPQTGVAPNKEAALLAGLTATSPIGQMIGQNLLSKKLAGPTYHNVAAGASLLQQTPEGKIESVYTNPKEIETPNEIKAAAYRLGINPNPTTWTPEQRMAIDQKVRQDKIESKSVTNVNVMPEQKVFENTQNLRKQFTQEPVYKGFQEVNSAYKQINDGLNMKSPAGDLAAATKFMKILDPGSVVRESELAMAMKATGALDRLQNYAGNIVKGTKLTPDQRNDFRKLSTDFYNSSAQQYNEKQKEYTDIAKRYNFNPKDVTGEPIKEENNTGWRIK